MFLGCSIGRSGVNWGLRGRVIGVLEREGSYGAVFDCRDGCVLWAY